MSWQRGGPAPKSHNSQGHLSGQGSCITCPGRARQGHALCVHALRRSGRGAAPWRVCRTPQRRELARGRGCRGICADYGLRNLRMSRAGRCRNLVMIKAGPRPALRAHTSSPSAASQSLILATAIRHHGPYRPEHVLAAGNITLPSAKGQGTRPVHRTSALLLPADGRDQDGSRNPGSHAWKHRQRRAQPLSASCPSARSEREARTDHVLPSWAILSVAGRPAPRSCRAQRLSLEPSDSVPRCLAVAWHRARLLQRWRGEER